MLKCIPMESLKQKAKSSSTSTGLSEEDEIVKCLLYWFKYEFFKWCDAPECTKCGKKTSFKEVAHPTTEEKNFLATTIEMYKCGTCKELTRFPRYNHPVKLCETKKGR
jgi:peptide-N4-(N-acetyl-beta-glucosaminyl)asparagine amidase